MFGGKLTGGHLVMFETFSFYACGVIVLALLMAYLCHCREKRWRAEDALWLARQREEEAQACWRQMPVESFDVAAIAPQIQRLRQNHLTAVHSRPHDSFYRRGLLAMFRQTVTSLPFFQRAGSAHEMQKHEA
jgi:hypothetical protein